MSSKVITNYNFSKYFVISVFTENIPNKSPHRIKQWHHLLVHMSPAAPATGRENKNFSNMQARVK